MLKLMGFTKYPGVTNITLRKRTIMESLPLLIHYKNVQQCHKRDMQTNRAKAQTSPQTHTITVILYVTEMLKMSSANHAGGWAMVAYTFSHCTQEAEAGDSLSQRPACTVECFQTVRAAQRNLTQKANNQNNNKMVLGTSGVHMHKK